MNGCFGCDHTNPAGLGIRFFRAADGRLAACCVPGEIHRGLGRVVNGGLVTTFGEELAALAAGELGDGGLVVSNLEVKYERPAYVGAEMRAIVTSTDRVNKSVDVTVDVSSGDVRVAQLKARFVLMSEERLREIAGIGLDKAPACLVAARKPLPTES